MSAMNNLPANWTVKPLGEACKTIKGKKPKNTGPAAVERSVPYINIKAFETGQAEEFAAPGNYPSCERDDVLIVWDGARAGLTGRAVPGYIGSTLAKVYSEEADNRYLFYFLQSQYGRINSRTKGVGIPHVDPTIFNNIPFPIAPLDQQKRIVAEIEKQFSRLDEAVANLKRVKANLKRYKAAVLKAAVEGRLVETEAELARREGRSYETGAQLLQRILETRRSQWQGKGKYKEPAAPDTTDLPELPEGWVWATLEQLTTQIADVDHKMPKAFEGGIPYVSTKDFSGDNDIDFAGAKRISPIDYDALCKKIRPEFGDILLSRYGTVGEVRTVKTDIPFQASYSVAILKPINSFETADFVATVLRSDVIQSQIKRDVRATAQPDLGLAHIRQFVVPLPSLVEQKQIIAEGERHLTLIDVAEAQVNANLLRANHLRQAILERGFAGKLLNGLLGPHCR